MLSGLRSISKLYVQDACINKRDNELGLGSVQIPACSAVHDTSASTCESVFTSGWHSLDPCTKSIQSQQRKAPRLRK